VPDVLHARVAQILKAAVDDTRLALLLHAHRRGIVAAKDAPGALSGGTPSYHVGILRKAGLLEPSAGRGEYRLTMLGIALLHAIGVHSDDDQDPSDSPIDEWLPPGTELVTTLERRLPSGRRDSTSVRLVRP
jgi:DNA-binding transcriptional ArsR family regulator